MGPDLILNARLVLSVAKGCRISPTRLHGSSWDVFLPAILLSGRGQPFSLQGQPRKRACFPHMWYSFAWNFWHHLLQPGTAASSQALVFGAGWSAKREMPKFLPGILQDSLQAEWGVQGTRSQDLTDPSSLWLAFIALGKQPQRVGVPENGLVVLVSEHLALPELSVLFMAQGLHCAWPSFCRHRCWGWGWIPWKKSPKGTRSSVLVSYSKCKGWKSRFWFLAFCCNSRSSGSVWLTARVQKEQDNKYWEFKGTLSFWQSQSLCSREMELLTPVLFVTYLELKCCKRLFV